MTAAKKAGKKAHTHRWNDWSYCGSKQVIQVRSCLDCDLVQRRKHVNMSPSERRQCPTCKTVAVLNVYGQFVIHPMRRGGALECPNSGKQA